MGTNKKLNIATGKMYKYSVILTAQSNGVVYCEIDIQDKEFNVEMTLRGLTNTTGMVKKIGTSSAREDIYVAMDNSFYLEDLNIITHNVEENTMFGRTGELSWEDCSHANWALNISGQTLPSLTLPLAAPVPTVSTAATTSVPQSMGHARTAAISVSPVRAISAPPVSAISSLPLTTGMFTTPPPVRPTAPLRLPTPSLTTIMAPTPNRSIQPEILKRIQESLKTKESQNMQTIQFLSNPDNFSIHPPNSDNFFMPPPMPSSSTPKKTKIKSNFKRKR